MGHIHRSRKERLVWIFLRKSGFVPGVAEDNEGKMKEMPG